MITVFDSVHSSSMRRRGAAINAPCAVCENNLLKSCQHEVGIFEIDHANELAILNKMTQESITGGPFTPLTNAE
jgi:hypothetical protein